MRVQVEVQYSSQPSHDELATMRWVAERLAANRDSVLAYLVETDQHRPMIVMEFELKTQAQYKVVDKIGDTVQAYAGRLYSDMTIRFPKIRAARKKARRVG